MSKPLIQIDDEIREMTDEEFAQYEKDISNAQIVLGTDNDD